MKRYKIDFNNGKVFEAVLETYDNNDFSTLLEIKTGPLGLTRHNVGVLKAMGATITEIKEPIKFECDVDWCVGVQMIIYPKGECPFHSLVGKRGRLTFIEDVEC